MRAIPGLLLGLVAIAVALAITLTPIGRRAAGPFIDTVQGLILATPRTAREVSRVDLVASVEDAAERAESYAAALRDGVELDRLAAELEAAAQAAGATTGALAIRASEVALEAAEAIPDLDALGSSLEGWQKQLAAYEMALRADDVDEDDAAATERDIAMAFAAPAPAQPAPARPEGAAVAFTPHNPFYKCPVIEVSNSGPANAERALTNYTPWVDTPAGVLIRAPVQQACLSSGYGTRVVDGASRNHAGVDYYNREGGEIYAAGDGLVTLAGEDGAYGNAVRIEHGGGVEGLYAHMVPGSLKVRVGDRVRLGQPIGMMGRSGRAYAVHLHYELREAGETVDPLYVGRRETF
jgi:murein DD-endopeptidase MepM/ murein hydrolase activator NlpD